MKLHIARSFAKPDPSLLSEIGEGVCKFGPIAQPHRRHLVLYGMGDMGRMAATYLKFVGNHAWFYIDERGGFDVLRPTDVGPIPKRTTQVLVSIANHPYVPIEKFLADLGFQHIAPFYDICESYRHIHPLSNGWFAEPFSDDDVEKMVRIYDRWADDISRAHYLQFVAWRALREEWAFEGAPVDTTNRYFIPEVVSVLHDHEVFVDGGAHDGRVSKEFERQFGGETVTIDAEGEQDIQFALGEALTSRPFHFGLGYASQLSRTGKDVVMIYDMDGLRLSPTFLKLHLEGHELPALRGAATTLERFRPILAITAYHNHDGLWRLPLHLMDSLPDYRWLWRNHAWVGTGAVVYGIPLERSV